MFFCGNSLEVTEGTEDCFVGAQLVIGIPTSKCLADGVRENSVVIRDGGDDAWHQIILQLEKRFRVEGALIAFCP